MNTPFVKDDVKENIADSDDRAQLLASIPAVARRIDLAGTSTAVLEGGEGPPVILLHGPGETCVWWMRVIPKLVRTHRVIVPDLPGHGASRLTDRRLSPDKDLLFAWLTELIKQTCASPPVLVGHLLGGSIAARFAVQHGTLLKHLILVDSFGLGNFRPAPGFAFRLIRFMLQPTAKNYSTFLPQCIYDTDGLRRQMAEHWEPFLAYNLACANEPDHKKALTSLMKQFGIPRIPSADLARIDIPTALIWGRHDRANKLAIAEAASKRYGWPLCVIENSRDDPKLEQPEAFVNAVHTILRTEISSTGANGRPTV